MRAVALLVALAAAVPATSSAQAVVADIRVAGGPVSGHIIIGHPRYRHRHAPVVVARGHVHRHECHAVLVRHGPPGRTHRFQRVTLWYHPATRRYYDHRHPYYRDLVRVTVRESGGRYWFDE